VSGHDTIIAEATGRTARADLVFAFGGGRTVLTRQTVPYPFHVTRPFQLDLARRDIATLYLQSASGGLYRGDDLGLHIAVRAGASAHVTTQAATMVHDTGAWPARQTTALDVADGGFLAYTPDPAVLFPGAALDSTVRIALAAGGRAIVVDGFAAHDPQGQGRSFDSLTQHLEIVDADGRCLVRERGLLRGVEFASHASPLGPFKALATILVLGPAACLPDGAALQRACDEAACLAGVSDLPNGAGRMLRCLARDGGALRHGLDAAFRVAFAALVGIVPAVRRK
jgi:urease accessory protein